MIFFLRLKLLKQKLLILQADNFIKYSIHKVLKYLYKVKNIDSIIINCFKLLNLDQSTIKTIKY